MTLRIARERMTTLASVRAADNCGCITPTEPSDAEIYELIDQASDAIALITAMKIRGRRTYIARPERCAMDWGNPCGPDEGVPLGEGDIEITHVKIDGATIAADEYELRSTLVGWSLVRVGDRTQRYYWPTMQDTWRDAGEGRTFEIEFTAGEHIDIPLVERAANEIVCYLNTIDDKRRTALPQGVTTASMGGVAVGVDYDRFQRIREEMREGRLGPAGSQLIGLYAPHRNSRPYVWAPEVMGGWELNLRFPTA